jgi:nucleotide-binding universal stress UspA family protein
MYKHILVPTDGSELSNHAIEYASALAKVVKAKLTVLTVSIPYYEFAVEPELTMIGLEEYENAIAKATAHCLDAAKDIAAAAGVSCETIHLKHPQPYQAIIETAKERKCDLIVMASHGRRGIAAIVLGSETNKVLTHSTIPVLVVRPPQPPTGIRIAS